jgi:hypothetical protein
MPIGKSPILIEAAGRASWIPPGSSWGDLSRTPRGNTSDTNLTYFEESGSRLVPASYAAVLAVVLPDEIAD